jgi:radical SAM superfamily enzyme YgiQ (UPF0313 family)
MPILENVHCNLFSKQKLKITLINPYELGRQPFGLAEPAAWLARAGCEVVCCDLSIQKLDDCLGTDTDVVAIYVAMHTATRIAVEALPKIRRLVPHAHLCVYGLYAPMNVELFRTLGVRTVIGGEYETGLVKMVRQLQAGEPAGQDIPLIHLGKTAFIAPDRSGLPPLDRYASLIMPDGSHRTVGFAEATRGCKYFCRHCPIVPVYHGRFFVVPVDIVLDDIRAQVAAGAEHISFGDPDFFNGPGHALRIVRAMHAEFPALTFDATIKIEHLVKYPEEILELGDSGCLFILSAVESVDDAILEKLDKGHTRADFLAALALMRESGIDLAPTFVAFTPWTTLEGYIDLLRQVAGLRLVEAVAPVQLSIRLLIPAGSHVLGIEGIRGIVDGFDPATLGHPWRNPDARVDALQQSVQAWISRAEATGTPRREIFEGVWRLAWEALGEPAPVLDLASTGTPVPRLSENWYCCAEPTCEQLVSF